MGNIKALDRYIMRSDGIRQFRKGRIPTKRENQDGYYIVKLSKNGISRYYHIHRLVAEAFLLDRVPNAEVNHIDFNRKNNCVDNLEWCSHKENISHSAKQGRYKTRNFNGENNPNYGNHILSEKYRNNKELAKAILGRRGMKNGRAKRVDLYDSDMVKIISFGYIAECAHYLIQAGIGVKLSTLLLRIPINARKNKMYHGYYFIIN